ncbi:MAG: peptide chain release factor N(5)-glutamine methyltransferase [Actinomycetes bacterium]
MLRELLRWGKGELQSFPSGSVDAEILLAFVLGISRTQLHSQSVVLDEAEQLRVADEFREAIEVRKSGKPIQYITGEAPFRYLVFDVGPGVLVPRPETEILVDEVLHQLQKFDEPISIVDLGAGSGAIAISLVSETAGKREVHAIAVEKSPAALVWLHQNIAKFDLPIRVIEADVETALMGIKCDVVVANPPYIPDFEQLPDDVLDFEPAVALRGGPDGMDVPRIFIATASRLLKTGGLLALEHHEMQEVAIREELAENYRDIKIHYDLANRARFTTAFKN